jgi:glutamine amidotransferase
MIVVIDCKISNLGSVVNIVKKVTGAPPVVSAKPEIIADATRLILPGVGAFDQGMRRLREAGIEPALVEAVRVRGTPLLGICLGMQLLTQGSEEGSERGLGWVEARTVRFGSGEPAWALRVPHMGWNSVRPVRDTPLLAGMYPEPRFYFVHSYHVVCDEPHLVTAVAHYGYDFACAIQKANIYGVQFHPEKSHKFGMKLLENFLARA